MVDIGFKKFNGLDGYLKQAEIFHGFLAPGLVMGGFMVDWACEQLGQREKLGAVSETEKCLPDAVSLLTACSIGNGYLKIFSGARFAISLYDAAKRDGIRVSMDTEKLKKFPLIQNWFFKKVEKKNNPLEDLNKHIIDAGRDIFKAEKIMVTKDTAEKTKLPAIKICLECSEAYRSGLEPICNFCKNGYYRSC